MIYRFISLGCAISLGLMVQAAEAQDSWAGGYLGVALSASEADAGISGSTVSQYGDRSATLGIYGGYNFVTAGGLVWGPDVLLTGLSSSGNAVDPAFGETEMVGSFLLSPRMRFGFATDSVYVYGVLGLGISDLSVGAPGNSDTDLLVTGAIGIGAEYALPNGWTARAEAMQYDFDGQDFTRAGGNTPINADVTQVTLGFAKRF